VAGLEVLVLGLQAALAAALAAQMQVDQELLDKVLREALAVVHLTVLVVAEVAQVRLAQTLHQIVAAMVVLDTHHQFLVHL
jgi:hypothetical protein